MALLSLKKTLESARAMQGAVKRTIAAGATFSGTVQRGMSLSHADLQSVISRREIVNKSLWSTTVSKAVASKNFGGNVRLHIKQKNGIALSKISKFKKEKEVLLPAGGRWKVKRVQTIGKVTHLWLVTK